MGRGHAVPGGGLGRGLPPFGGLGRGHAPPFGGAPGSVAACLGGVHEPAQVVVRLRVAVMLWVAEAAAVAEGQRVGSPNCEVFPVHHSTLL